MTDGDRIQSWARIVRDTTGARTILMLDEQPQAVVILEHPHAEELILGVLDRDGDRAAVTLTVDGITELRDALEAWLRERNL